MKEIKIVSAEKYCISPKKDYHKVYEFPLEPLSETRGRVNWNFEFIRSKKKDSNRYYITEVLVFAGQTDDKRYQNTFSIPCYTEQFWFNDINDDSSSFFQFGFCSAHKNPIIRVNPKDHQKVLQVEVGSSILCNIKFRPI